MSQATAAPPSAREALVRAAIEAFGRDGFDAVSTRRIAAAAGVNSALISYYFEGKEGLYGACVEAIAGTIAGRLGPLGAAVEARLVAGAGDRASARCGLKQLLSGFLALLTQPEVTPWARIILREQQDPTAHFEVLYGRVMAPFMDLMTRLCADARGAPAANADDRLTAITLFGQISIFRAHRAAVLATMGWPEVGADEQASIERVVHRHIDRIFDHG